MCDQFFPAKSKRLHVYMQSLALEPVLLLPARVVYGRVFAWGSEGCGFDPQPRQTKSRKKMVQVAPLLTLGIER